MLHAAVRRFLIALCCAAVYSEPASAARELPPPGGPHGVGRVTMYVIDDDRAETWTDDPNDKRALPLIVWYPASVSKGAQFADYFPYPAENVHGSLALERARGRALTMHTYTDVPLPGGSEKFPVLLFSPGGGSAPTAYHALIEGIVSHGFVVVGMDHAYEGAGQIMADGRRIEPAVEAQRPRGDRSTREFAEASRAFYFRQVGVRAQDAGSAMSILRLMNNDKRSKFSNRLDLTRVGVFGHSIGGVAAAHALADVEAIKAGVNIDGHAASMPFDEAHTPAKPFMCIEAPGLPPTDEDLARYGMTREAFDAQSADAAERHATAYRRNPTVSYRVTIDAADHGHFSDDIFLMKDDDGSAAAERVGIMLQARAFIVDFFRSSLLGQPAPVLVSPPPGTRVERFGAGAVK